jgi:hypothetical protein
MMVMDFPQRERDFCGRNFYHVGKKTTAVSPVIAPNHSDFLNLRGFVVRHAPCLEADGVFVGTVGLG